MGRAQFRPIASSGGPLGQTLGALDSATWQRKFGGDTPAIDRWHVEIAMGTTPERPPAEFDAAIATRFHINLYSEEWGIYFCHGGRSSWIRVTDLAFVHGRDDFGLLSVTPPLKDLGGLLRRLEQTHVVRFQRPHASIQTNLPGAEPAIRAWLTRL
jgi:hypothetical protein